MNCKNLNSLNGNLRFHPNKLSKNMGGYFFQNGQKVASDLKRLISREPLELEKMIKTVLESLGCQEFYGIKKIPKSSKTDRHGGRNRVSLKVSVDPPGC